MRWASLPGLDGRIPWVHAPSSPSNGSWSQTLTTVGWVSLLTPW